MDWKVERAKKGLRGELSPPPDKSISHRAIMFASIARGECRIANFLFSEDCMRTLEAFRAMGSEIRVDGDTVTVKGRGLRGLEGPPGELYLGNSGTTMRVISGILAGQDFTTVLSGDESLSHRPMKRVIEPLSLMGADIEPIEGGYHAPLRIKGGKFPLRPVDYRMSVASAQVKSCVLAAGLYADGRTSVTEPFQSRDHTERMMEYFSASIERKGLRTEIVGPGELVSGDLRIPGDISSAAFFIVGALLVEGSRIIIRNTGLNPTRTGIIDVLKRMGAEVRVLEFRDQTEPEGDLEVCHSGLVGTVVREEEIPLLIDEVPLIAVAAAMAEGTTEIKGIKELKVKETDRIGGITENLSRMGVRVREDNGSLVIEGSCGNFKAAELDSFGDHRIAMSMAVAALVSDGSCIVRNTACADTSYPGFIADLEKVGR